MFASLHDLTKEGIIKEKKFRQHTQDMQILSKTFVRSIKCLNLLQLFAQSSSTRLREE
jgi:hypothetical protein